MQFLESTAVLSASLFVRAIKDAPIPPNLSRRFRKVAELLLCTRRWSGTGVPELTSFTTAMI
jgi:hypothetical protein